MTPVIRVIAIGIVTVAAVFGMIGAINWAKHTKASAAVGTVLLALSAIVVGKAPENQYIEQLKEDKAKKGGESGAPPLARESLKGRGE